MENGLEDEGKALRRSFLKLLLVPGHERVIGLNGEVATSES